MNITFCLNSEWGIMSDQSLLPFHAEKGTKFCKHKPELSEEKVRILFDFFLNSGR